MQGGGGKKKITKERTILLQKLPTTDIFIRRLRGSSTLDPGRRMNIQGPPHYAPFSTENRGHDLATYLLWKSITLPAAATHYVSFDARYRETRSTINHLFTAACYSPLQCSPRKIFGRELKRTPLTHFLRAIVRLDSSRAYTVRACDAWTLGKDEKCGGGDGWARWRLID